MGDSRTPKQCIQAVFLIDTLKFHENNGNEELLDKAFRATSTSVLRLLTYLANRFDCDKEKFAWGCQFFKIPLKTHFYSKRSVFREFTRSTFADFEKQLRQEIDTDAGKSSLNTKENHRAAAEISPAFSLKYALHDASLEYRWDEPIISSPVKSAFNQKKKRNQTNPLPVCGPEAQQKKFVFVLLPCPLTVNDLEEFTENKAPFTSSSLKRTLINLGRQESSLFDYHGASLFWLDTRILWESKSTCSESKPKDEQTIPDHSGYTLINETLALVRGSVIPLGCLTDFARQSAANISQLILERPLKLVAKAEGDSTHNPVSVTASATPESDQKPATGTHVKPATNSQDVSVEQKQIIASNEGSAGEATSGARNVLTRWGIPSTASGSPALPYTSSLDHITQNKLSKSADPANFDGAQVVRLYSSACGTATVKCLLKLQLLWKSHPARLSSPQLGQQDKPSAADILLIDAEDEALTIPVNPAVRSAEASVAGTSNESQGPNGGVPQGSILGAVPRGLLSLDLYQSSEVYSCLGFDKDDVSGEESSTWFQELLLSLSCKNLLLVVELFDRFAVLEPLTPVMGTLRVIDSTRMMALERVVAFDGIPVGDPGDLMALGKKDSDPGSRTMRVLHQEVTSAREKGRSKSTKLSLDLHRGTKSLKPFSSSCLEPWYQDLPQRGVTAKFLEQLVRIPENVLVDDSVNLDSALSQLKSLYKTGNSASPTTQKKCKKNTVVKQEVAKEKTGAKLTKRESKIMRKCTARTRSILENSRRVDTKVPQESPKQEKARKKPESNQLFIPDKDFTSLQDLQSYVEEAYSSTVSTTSSLLSCAQQIVFLTVHFMKEQNKDGNGDDVPNMVKTFLREFLLKSNPELIKKYQDTELEQKIRMREAKLQALLRFEVEVAFPSEVKDPKVTGQTKGGQDEESDQSVFNSSADDTDSELPEEVQEIVDEISQLLSSIPLLADHDQLLSFLDDVVLTSYSDTIPYMVRAVFEGLGHPVPNELMSPTSSKPSVRPPLSHSSVRSWGSVDAAPASSTRSRTLTRHPSLADASHKRIIPIHQPRRAKTKKLATKKEDPETEAKKAKRNLFSNDSGSSAGGSKLVRRESIAVMEGISKPRRQSPRKHLQGPPPRVLKTRTVKETPGKRQVSKAVLCNVNRARKLEARLVGKPLSPTIEVIEESPVKPLASSAPRMFPRHLTRARNLSFYSQDKVKSTKQTLQEARRLTARITGSSPEAVLDIASKVQMKKSPARSLLKDVCTPSTLGSLSRLRSGHVTLGEEGSPDLKPVSQNNESSSSINHPIGEQMLTPKRETRRARNTPVKQVGEGDATQIDSKAERGFSPMSKTKGAQVKRTLIGTVTESPPNDTDLKQILSPTRMTRSATKATSMGEANEGVDPVNRGKNTSSDSAHESGDDTGRVPPGRPGNETPRKRKSLRTSLKTMFDGVAQENTPPKDRVVTGIKKRKMELEERQVLEEADNRLEDATDAANKNGGSPVQKTSIDLSPSGNSLRSPLRKRQRTSTDAKQKNNLIHPDPGNGTPSPKRKLPAVLASPEMFQQWPRRKLRSTPSPNSHFVRGSSKNLREAGKRSTRKSPANPSRPADRSLSKRSKTCLKFPAAGGSSQEKDAEHSGEVFGYLPGMESGKENLPEVDQGRGNQLDAGPVPVGANNLRQTLLKREASAEELERHFSFHSDDDEIEFVKVDRTLSKDSMGMPRDDGQESPVFSGNSSDMQSPGNLQSPFKSPGLRRRPARETSGSPVFNYVSTPNSAGLRLTIRRRRSSAVSGGSIVPSSVSPCGRGASTESSTPGLEGSSSATSENDDVFPSLCEARPQSTPPGSSRKVNCNLSTKGLYGLLHSPFAGSPGQRLGTRNKPLPVSGKPSRNAAMKKDST